MLKLILAALLLVACSDPMPPDPATLNQSWCLVDVPDADVPLIAGAMAEWNQKTNQRTAWHVVEHHCDATIRRVHTITVQDDWIGDTINRQEILYEDSLSGARLTNVLLHELGHVANLEHSDNPDDVMYYMIISTPKTELSAGDVEAFHAYWW